MFGYSFAPTIAVAEEVEQNTSSVVEELVQSSTIDDSSIVEETPATEENVENSANNEFESDIPESSVVEGETDGLIPESEGSKWFDTYIMPIIIGISAPLIGTVTGGGLLGWVLFKGSKLFKGLLTSSIEGLKKAKEQTDKANTDLTDTREQLSEFQKFQNKVLSQLEEEQKKAMLDLTEKLMTAFQEWELSQGEAMRQWETRFEEQMKLVFEELRNVMADKVDDANTTVHKLLEVENIVYGDNPVLVSNGTAKKVAEVVNR
jgi:hypothetical protein